MNIVLYAHGGSANHGCEALVRSTIKALGNAGCSFSLLSEKAEEDFRYRLDELAAICPAQEPLPQGMPGFFYKLRMKFQKDDRLYYKARYRSFIQKAGEADWALAIGGDNYCYKGFLEQFGTVNALLFRHKIPSALWGCSIDPYRINAAMLDDLRKYRFITARESITCQALKKAGLPNVHLVPDTAFALDKTELPLPGGFEKGNTVGINVSPLVIGHEKAEGVTLANYEHLISYILRQTDMPVALIPHVVWQHNDDRIPLARLYDKFKHTGRVVLINDCNAMELKGYISRCRFLIAARTHASIAGYSTGVPTLVVGYSVKAKGIATDLFGTDRHYVLPIESLSRADNLTQAFRWLQTSEDKIRNHYRQRLAAYKEPLSHLGYLFK